MVNDEYGSSERTVDYAESELELEPPAHPRAVTNLRQIWSIPTDRIELDPEENSQEVESQDLDRLAAWMLRFGQVEPIMVRWDEPRMTYVVILGEKRWRAAKLAGIPSLEAFVYEGPTDRASLLEIQFHDKAHTVALKPHEIARTYKDLMDRSGWTVARVGVELGIAQSTVTDALRLLKSSESAQGEGNEGSLSPDTTFEPSNLRILEDVAETSDKRVAEGLQPSHLRLLAHEPVARESRFSNHRGLTSPSGGSWATSQLADVEE